MSHHPLRVTIASANPFGGAGVHSSALADYLADQGEAVQFVFAANERGLRRDTCHLPAHPAVQVLPRVGGRSTIERSRRVGWSIRRTRPDATYLSKGNPHEATLLGVLGCAVAAPLVVFEHDAPPERVLAALASMGASPLGARPGCPDAAPRAAPPRGPGRHQQRIDQGKAASLLRRMRRRGRSPRGGSRTLRANGPAPLATGWCLPHRPRRSCGRPDERHRPGPGRDQRAAGVASGRIGARDAGGTAGSGGDRGPGGLGRSHPVAVDHRAGLADRPPRPLCFVRRAARRESFRRRSVHDARGDGLRNSGDRHAGRPGPRGDRGRGSTGFAWQIPTPSPHWSTASNDSLRWLPRHAWPWVAEPAR